MSMTWALSVERHDLSIVRGRIPVVLGADEVRQRVLVTLQHHWREYFLNVASGVPWYDAILGSKDKQLVGLILRQVVLSVPGVVSIVDMDVRFSATTPRHLLVDMSLEVASIARSPSTKIIQGGVMVGIGEVGVSFRTYDWAQATPLPA